MRQNPPGKRATLAASSGGQWLYMLNHLAVVAHHYLGVVTGLQRQPEAGRGAKSPCHAQGSVRRNAAEGGKLGACARQKLKFASNERTHDEGSQRLPSSV